MAHGRVSPSNDGQDNEPTKEPAAAATDNGGPLQRAARCIDHGIQKAFFKLGWAVASRPCATIAIAVVLTVIMSLGALNKEVESRSEVVWAPSNSDAGLRLGQVATTFGSSPRTSTLYIRSKPEGANVLTVTAISDLITLAKDIEGVVVDAPYNEQASRSWTWPQLCQTRNGVCWMTSIADAFSYNTSLVQQAAGHAQGIGGWLYDKQQAGQLRDVFGGVLDLSTVLGDTSTSGSVITSAKYLRLQFRLENRSYKDASGSSSDPPAEAFEEAALAKIGTDTSAQSFAGVAVLATIPAGEAAERSAAIRGDVAMVASSIFLILIYLVVNLGNCSRVGSRVALASGAGVIVYMALSISTGLGSLLTFESNIHSVLPFLIAGIGVDDIFVMTHEFDRAGDIMRSQGKPRDLRLQMARAMASAGSSISLTSLTDVVAFSIGATTALPGLEWFCIWAAFAVIAVFSLSVTLYAALLVLDARRQHDKRMDVLCCVRGPAVDRAAPPASCCCCCLRPRAQERSLTWLARNVLTTKPAKAVVVLAFLALAAGSVVSTLGIKEEFRREWFLPTDSYLWESIEVSDNHFSSFGAPVGLYATDVELWQHRVELAKLGPLLAANEYTEAAVPVTDWAAGFAAYLSSQSLSYETVSEADFNSNLQAFLANPAYGRYQSSIVMAQGSSSQAKMVRVTGFYKKLDSASDEVAAMNSLKDAFALWSSSAGVQGFAFSVSYTSWALFEIVRTEAVQNLALAILAVFVVVLLFLADLLTAIVVTFSVCMVLLSILGLMVLWDVALNSISVVNLVLSIGFAVDYSVHIAHSYLHASGPANDRAVTALQEMGVSVFNGATSTLLAVAVLGFSQSYIFSVFFKMLLLSCVSGLLHGMVFLPVMLTLVNPKTHTDVELEAGDDSKQATDIEMAVPVGTPTAAPAAMREE